MSNGDGIGSAFRLRDLREWVQVGAILVAAVVAVMAIRSTTGELQVQLADMVDVLKDFRSEMHRSLENHEERLRREEIEQAKERAELDRLEPPSLSEGRHR